MISRYACPAKRSLRKNCLNNFILYINKYTGNSWELIGLVKIIRKVHVKLRFPPMRCRHTAAAVIRWTERDGKVRRNGTVDGGCKLRRQCLATVECQFFSSDFRKNMADMDIAIFWYLWRGIGVRKYWKIKKTVLSYLNYTCTFNK